MMSEYLRFSSREEFHSWLAAHGQSSDGIWLLFGKTNEQKTISANEALEEALCFGWIDGQMQSLDDQSYIKYFSLRRPNSKWSDKNKAIAGQLEQRGLLTPFGKAKIEEAKKNGQWDLPKAPPISEEQILMLTDLLKAHEPACTNFLNMSPSVKKTYAKAYFDAKTDAGRANRMVWMIERLNRNLKPM